MTLKFFSKQDWWLQVIIWITIAISLWSGVLLLFFTSYSIANYFWGMFSIVIVIGILWLVTTTYYVIHGELLIVRAGPYRRSIPIDAIISVKKTKNPLSSPALSINRIEVKYRKDSFQKFVLISPKEEETFVQKLIEKNPNIVYE